MQEYAYIVRGVFFNAAHACESTLAVRCTFTLQSDGNTNIAVHLDGNYTSWTPVRVFRTIHGVRSRIYTIFTKDSGETGDDDDFILFKHALGQRNFLCDVSSDTDIQEIHQFLASFTLPKQGGDCEIA